MSNFLWLIQLQIPSIPENISNVTDTKRNYFDILTKAFKYIIFFFSCDILQSSFEILNQNFVDIPRTK